MIFHLCRYKEYMTITSGQLSKYMTHQSTKEYGNFSLNEFEQVISRLPEIRNQVKELPDLLNSAPENKIKEFLGKGLCWAAFYELSFQELLAVLICALECHQELCKAAQSDDPPQAAFSMFQNVAPT